MFGYFFLYLPVILTALIVHGTIFIFIVLWLHYFWQFASMSVLILSYKPLVIKYCITTLWNFIFVIVRVAIMPKLNVMYRKVPFIIIHTSSFLYCDICNIIIIDQIYKSCLIYLSYNKHLCTQFVIWSWIGSFTFLYTR